MSKKIGLPTIGGKYYTEPHGNTTVWGESIRRYRRQRDESQADIADKLGVSVQTVSGWERGVTTPTLRKALHYWGRLCTR